MNQLERLESLAECHACVTPFHDNPHALIDNIQLSHRLPTQGTKCQHYLCRGCLWQLHMVAAAATTMTTTTTTTRRSSQRFLSCPFCHAPQSFDPKRARVDIDLCLQLQATRKSRHAVLKVTQKPIQMPLSVWPHAISKLNESLQQLTDKRLHVDVLHQMVTSLSQLHEFYGS
jgi:hypothetical protein